MERQRRVREALMRDMQKFEETIIEPYMEVYNASSKDWLTRIAERSQVVLETNEQLQKQLADLEAKLRLTESANSSRSEEWEAVQANVDISKSKQNQLQAQVQEVRQSGLLEEERLREQNVTLRTKLSKFARINKRLEDQKRLDDLLVERNQKVLDELRLVQLQLETVKAEYEMGNFGENVPMRTKFQRFSLNRQGSNTSRCSVGDRSGAESPASVVSKEDPTPRRQSYAQAISTTWSAGDTRGFGKAATASPSGRRSIKKSPTSANASHLGSKARHASLDASWRPSEPDSST